MKSMRYGWNIFIIYVKQNKLLFYIHTTITGSFSTHPTNHKCWSVPGRYYYYLLLFFSSFIFPIDIIGNPLTVITSCQFHGKQINFVVETFLQPDTSDTDTKQIPIWIDIILYSYEHKPIGLTTYNKFYTKYTSRLWPGNTFVAITESGVIYRDDMSSNDTAIIWKTTRETVHTYLVYGKKTRNFSLTRTNSNVTACYFESKIFHVTTFVWTLTAEDIKCKYECSYWTNYHNMVSITI